MQNQNVAPLPRQQTYFTFLSRGFAAFALADAPRAAEARMAPAALLETPSFFEMAFWAFLKPGWAFMIDISGVLHHVRGVVKPL